MTPTPRPLLLALGSAVLLILSFPNFNQPWYAWVALVPWLVLLRSLRGKPAFWWSWLIGFLFFAGSVWWLLHLTRFGGAAAILGWLLLCAYLALYFGLFGLVVSRLVTSHQSPVTSHLVTACAWVALEYLRSHLLSGFGWNLLGYSQSSRLQIIQVADLTGVWGVSFVIVLANAVIAEMAHALLWRKGRRAADRLALPRATGHMAVATALVCAALGYGSWRLAQLEAPGSVRVAVVQGNVPQEHKWDEAHRDAIMERYTRLTAQVAATQPRLIVLPETATPGYLGLEESVTQWVIHLARAVHIPLLVGAPMGTLHGTMWHLTNSAALVDETGAIRERYDKLHLVPFGEFVPGERTFPWLRRLLPPIGEFVPGGTYTVFHSPLSFSVLICFEDLFPDLARRFVQRGAQALFVITNDAWFGPSAAAYQHAQASTLRAIELRVPVARAANTGWSGCIDPAGRWIGSVRDPAGRELFVEGTHTCDLPLGPAQSLYLVWGDWFALACLLVTAISVFRGRRNSPTH